MTEITYNVKVVEDQHNIIVTAPGTVRGVINHAANGGHMLHELNDVYAENPSDGDILVWNAANGRWQAVSLQSLLP